MNEKHGSAANRNSETACSPKRMTTIQLAQQPGDGKSIFVQRGCFHCNDKC